MRKIFGLVNGETRGGRRGKRKHAQVVARSGRWRIGKKKQPTENYGAFGARWDGMTLGKTNIPVLRI